MSGPKETSARGQDRDEVCPMCKGTYIICSSCELPVRECPCAQWSDEIGIKPCPCVEQDRA